MTHPFSQGRTCKLTKSNKSNANETSATGAQRVRYVCSCSQRCLSRSPMRSCACDRKATEEKCLTRESESPRNFRPARWPCLPQLPTHFRPSLQIRGRPQYPSLYVQMPGELFAIPGTQYPIPQAQAPKSPIPQDPDCDVLIVAKKFCGRWARCARAGCRRPRHPGLKCCFAYNPIPTNPFLRGTG